MTPDKEQSMRSQLAEYAKSELVDLAIKLQDVIDAHIHEKNGLQTSIDAIKGQIPVLQAELDKYEGGPQVDSAEAEALEQENSTLRERCKKLQALNEGLQEKMLA